MNRTRGPAPVLTVDPWVDSPATSGAQHFSGDGDVFAFSVLDGALVFELDRVRFDRGDLWGTLTVRTSLSGARTAHDDVLTEGTINLSSVDTRQNAPGWSRTSLGRRRLISIGCWRLSPAASMRSFGTVSRPSTSVTSFRRMMRAR